MKLLFSIDHLYLHGGAEKVLTHRVNYLAEQYGYDVTVLTTEQKNNPTCYQLSDKIKRIDLAVNYFREKSYFHPSNVAKIPYHFKQLNQTIKDVKPDVIIILNYAFDFYWLPYIFKNIPKVKEYHSSRFYQLEGRKSDGLFKSVINSIIDFVESKYDKIIVLNPTEKQFYNNKNIAVIPNPVALSSQLADVSSKQVIAAGRIAPVKGFEKLIAAWELVAKECPEWKLNIYGQGEKNYIQTLEALIQEKQLENHVFLQPATDQLLDKMLQHSIFVMSSVTECFPMVLLESLTIGLPIISFDCPTGPANIVSHEEDGLLVKNQDSVALAEKLVFLINNEKLRQSMRDQGKQNSKRFSEEAIMQVWHNMLTQIINKNE